jgi:hypothetical protein
MTIKQLEKNLLTMYADFGPWRIPKKAQDTLEKKRAKGIKADIGFHSDLGFYILQSFKKGSRLIWQERRPVKSKNMRD